MTEAQFEFSELFFSETDPRGIIVTGNSVFQRVSEYSWDELRGKPHNLIRHPDMPRGVFYLFWDYLTHGNPIGAFVKNRSKSGKHYWVFALAMPVEGGFLSVRLKPGGDLLNTIESEYRRLRDAENTEKLKPEVSRDRLASRIQELGYASYSRFMTEALVNQILNRQAELKMAPPHELAQMLEMKNLSLSILTVTEQILSSFTSSQFVPLNLEIFSQKAGGEGLAISVVAQQYQKISTEITGAIRNFKKMSEEVSDRVSDSQFYVGAAALLEEVRKYLGKEGTSDQSAFSKIDTVAKNYRFQALDRLSTMAKVIQEFISICNNLNTLGLGLELVRLTGKIELSRMQNATEAATLLDSLRHFQTALKEGLSEVSGASESMRSSARALFETLK